MRLYRWLLLIGLLVILRHLVAGLPVPKLPDWSKGNLPLGLSPFDRPTQENCPAARPAVVTIFAGREIGSGSVLTPNGMILTNNHVIREAPDDMVWVRMFNGQRYRGKVFARDTTNDLALVQLGSVNNLPTIRLAATSNPATGEQVCAIGSPFGRTGIISHGLLTGTRGNGDLQTQILLHPGNSGGPLLNQKGEMIGVNKSIWLSDSGENTGISFATNANVAQTFIAQNQDKGTSIARLPLQADTTGQIQPEPLGFGGGGGTSAPPPAPVPSPSGARLGVIVKSENLRVQIVEPNSPAEQAGLNSGDRLLAINGQPLQSFDELRQFLSTQPSQATFTVKRQQGIQEIRVKF